MWFRLTGDERLGACASDGCGGQPTWRLEAGGIGSNYCSGCKEKIELHGAYMDGFGARLRGFELKDNPFHDFAQYDSWRRGWLDQDHHLTERNEALASIGWFGGR